MELPLIIILFGIISSSIAFQCPKGAGCRPCDIYPNGEYEIQCGINEYSTAFIVKYKPEGYVSITCTGTLDWSEFHLGSIVPIPDVKRIHFRMCKLPEENQLGAIVKTLLTDNIVELDFCSYDNLTSSLSRDTLKKFYGIERLTLASNSLANITSDLMQDLTNLTLLNLRENNLRELPRNFLNLPKLRSLELGINELEVIKDYDFDYLTNLTLLNLWNNRLTEIQPHAFDKLTSVTSIDLHRNKLQTLPNDIFSKLTKLRKLNLSQNNFTSDTLPQDLLKNCSSLESFKFTDNRRNITTLPNGFLSNLKNLTLVTLKRNGLLSLPEDLLWGAASLKTLNIERNYLKTISKTFFKDCINLQTLDLSFNEINYLPDDVFVALNNLEILDLSRNHITTISENLLNGLSSLQVIKMERNGLTTIDLHAFKSLQNLRAVHFSYNNLTLNSYSLLYADKFGLNSPFHPCQRTLEELHFAHNNITEIFTDWIFATHLRTLDLSYNQLTSLQPSDMQFLSQNINVDLTFNQIKNIFFIGAEELAESQNYPRNINVDVQSNPISCGCNLYDLLRFMEGNMHPYVQNLFNLRIGNMECNEPALLKGIDIRDLKSDSLTCDFIESPRSNASCPHSCKCAIRPENRAFLIDCSYQGLTIAPAPFETPFKGPVEMNLSGNHLKLMPSLNQPGYRQVTHLFLSHNNISKIHRDSLSENLESIFIDNNNIKNVDSNVLNYWKNSSKLRHLNLQRNSLSCDCNARDLLNFIQTSQSKIPELQRITCATTDVFIFEMTPEEICPVIHDWIIGLAIGVAMFGIVLGAVAALYYRYQHEIKVWLYAHQLCLWFVTEDELDKDKRFDAFISFSQKDESFVTKELVPNLEQGPKPFKLCVHYRDWVAGEWIPKQIARSIEDSRRTVVVLSPNFLESVWGRLEFRAAHSQALREGRARVIIILYGDIGPTEDLDPELKAYLNMNTYVRWGDPWFWEKLRYALPHATDFMKLKKTKSIFETHHPTIHINTDKSGLIQTNGISTTPPLTSTPPADAIKTFIQIENEIMKNTTLPYRTSSAL